MKSFLRIVLFFGFLSIPILVLAQPGIPHQFYGTVNFSSGPAPNGILVEAKLSNGTVAGSDITNNGKYGYNPGLFFVTDPNSNLNGQTLTFYVNGINTGTAVFSSGGYTEKNLTVPGSMGNITKAATDVIQNQEIAVAPNNSTNIQMGSGLSVTVSSAVNTNADVEKIQKIENNNNSFFSGTKAILAGKTVLNAYEIKITGNNLSITITISYDDTGIDESTVAPYRYSTTTSSWVAITPYTKDTSANTITFTIASGQTPYVVFGQQAVSGGGSTGGGGGGGGGGGTSQPATTVTKGDANNDNKIDILDFNALMINWGKTGTNVADFNGDGKVDIFDFNLLMINWGK